MEAIPISIYSAEKQSSFFYYSLTFIKLPEWPGEANLRCPRSTKGPESYTETGGTGTSYRVPELKTMGGKCYVKNSFLFRFLLLPIPAPKAVIKATLSFNLSMLYTLPWRNGACHRRFILKGIDQVIFRGTLNNLL